jgi:hypothetical protein
MIVLMPAPVWSRQIIKGVQKKRKAMTDARVRAVKQTLNVLGMLNQLALEEEVQEEIEALRAEEFQWTFRTKDHSLVNVIVTSVPII